MARPGLITTVLSLMSVSLAFLSACEQQAQALLLPQGTLLNEKSFSNELVQEQLEAILTRNETMFLWVRGEGSLKRNKETGTIEWSGGKPGVGWIQVTEVYRVGPDAFCKKYILALTGGAKERGVICKSEEHTGGKWVGLDTWNALPRADVDAKKQNPCP